mmetsp:Transcript_173370/g.556104  ORF Transcript_173370/g.556104 Transcript_173370/m.556104 type:complete len:226 (+) Transcript_173370:556-1233(+)
MKCLLGTAYHAAGLRRSGFERQARQRRCCVGEVRGTPAQRCQVEASNVRRAGPRGGLPMTTMDEQMPTPPRHSKSQARSRELTIRRTLSPLERTKVQLVTSHVREGAAAQRLTVLGRAAEGHEVVAAVQQRGVGHGAMEGAPRRAGPRSPHHLPMPSLHVQYVHEGARCPVPDAKILHVLLRDVAPEDADSRAVGERGAGMVVDEFGCLACRRHLMPTGLAAINF